MPAPESSCTRGHNAETAACEYLEKSGLKTIARNFRGRYGEIDLVMQDRLLIVFVEVRYRSNNSRLDAVETIDTNKCNRIIKTAMQFMQTLRDPDSHGYRFDVVTVCGSLDNPVFDWIQDAFQA